MYAEYLAAENAGAGFRKSFERLALNWQVSKTTVCNAIQDAKKRRDDLEKTDPNAFRLTPADILGQIERAGLRLEGLKKEMSLVEENLRKMFRLVPKDSAGTGGDLSKGSKAKRGARTVRVYFLSSETREFQLSAGYGSAPDHKLTPDEEAFEKHRYVIRDLLEPEHTRTEPQKTDESLVRLRKEIDRKKLMTWAPVVMRMRNLVNAWEDLERGVILERDLEALSDYLTWLEKKNSSKGFAQMA